MIDDDTPAKPEIDKAPALSGNDDGTKGHYSGEEYDSSDKDTPRYVEAGASRGSREAALAKPNKRPGENIPADAGRRAYIDEKTGEVHGSGAGAGGGNSTEDYDADTSGGGGEVRQTRQSRDGGAST
jgi:hypothetical protein